MTSIPSFLKQGETARLFPVLNTTSKEGRATSILLSCLAHVSEFATTQIKTLGLKAGKRTSVECFTEIVFAESTLNNKRPDGLIVIDTGMQKKHFLVEAKIGNTLLNIEQIENYIKICKEHDMDGIITISNQYTSRPDIHPIEAVRKIKGKVPVYHWSWMSVLTNVNLLVNNQEISDNVQMSIMNEFRRFLSHDSTGVKGFDRMPAEWAEANKVLSNQGRLTAKSDIAHSVVAAWQQEARDLCLILSRLTNTVVTE